MSENEKPYPVIHALECKACGRCVVDCPQGCLKMGVKVNKRGYKYVEYTGQGCTGCGNCFYTCPEISAISVHIPLKDKDKDSNEG